MRKIKLIPGALVAVLLTGTAGAFAAQGQNVKQIEAERLASAKLSLAEAITQAEKTAMGKALEAALEDEDGKLFYEVEILKDGKATELQMDAATGQILSHKDEGMLSKWLDSDEKAERAALESAPVNLIQAIAAAEQQLGSKAIGATLESENGKAVYEVEVIKDGKEYQVQVNITDGKVLSSKPDTDDGDENG